MSYAFITQFVNMVICIIFSCRGDDFSFVSIRLAHTDGEWNPCWVLGVYCQVQVSDA